MTARAVRLALLLALVAATAAARKPADDLFVGTWEGPANVYDDAQVMKPTNAHVVITREGERYVVEITVLDGQLTRLTRCEPAAPGRLRVRDRLLVDLRQIKVDGVLVAAGHDRIESGVIQFFVETADGGYRPYYTIRFAAKRVAASTPTPAPTPETTPAP